MARRQVSELGDWAFYEYLGAFLQDLQRRLDNKYYSTYVDGEQAKKLRPFMESLSIKTEQSKDVPKDKFKLVRAVEGK